MKNQTICYFIGIIFGMYGWEFIERGHEWWLPTIMFGFMFIMGLLGLSTEGKL